MAGVLLAGVIWLLTYGFDAIELLKEAAFFTGMGFFIGREVQFRAFRREFLGVAKGRHDDWYSAAAGAWMIWGLIGTAADLWYGPWSGALARFVLWWMGVFLATFAAVRTQMHLERVLLSVPWREDEPHWAEARRLAQRGVRYEGRVGRRIRWSPSARSGDAREADRPPPKGGEPGSELIEELRRRALSMLLGNEVVLDRLIAYERRRSSGASETEILHSVIDEIRRDQS